MSTPREDAASPVTFVLVGHCSPDSGMLSTAVRRASPAAKVVRANDDGALEAHRGPGRVWLVNRVLDGSFASDDGLALIAREAQRTDGPRLVLVSNVPEAQSRAISLGALPGFGKRAVHAESTIELLRGVAVVR